MIGVRAFVLAAAATLALLALSHALDQPAPIHDGDFTVAFVSTDMASGPVLASSQQDAATNDDLLEVQMWTLFAVGGAAGLGLVLFLVRMALGLVKPPPPQEDPKH